jgi:hypothetical protein
VVATWRPLRPPRSIDDFVSKRTAGRPEAVRRLPEN